MTSYNTTEAPVEVRNDGGEFFFMNEKFSNFNKLEIGKV